MKKLLLTIVFLVILLSSCTSKNKNNQATNNKSTSYKSAIDSLLENYKKNDAFMGTLNLSYKGKSIYSKSIGFSNLTTSQKSNSATKYRIGSISKTFTAVLVLKAIEEGKLELNNTIETFFPSIKNTTKITIADLLQHRSGIHNFTRDQQFFEYRTQHQSPKKMLDIISKYPSDFEPNTKAAYSNSNYFLLALILEKIYNASLEQLLLEKISKPLNLKNTQTGKKINSTNNQSYSYSFKEKWREFPETDMSITKGSGDIISTAKDVNIFIEALFTSNILTPKSLNLMKTIKDDFGMGLIRYKINDRQGFGHRGNIDGFRSTAIYFPKEKLAFTLISNGAKVDINTIYSEILKLYFNDALIDISEAEIKKFAGTYVYEKDSNDIAAFIQDKTTLVHVIKDEFKKPLVYKGNNKFIFNQMYAESITFTFSADGKSLLFEQGSYKGKYIKKE